MTTLQQALRSSSSGLRVSALFSAKTISRFFSLSRQRQALGKLDDSALMDIGLHRDEADAEARRPVWDVPAYWLK